MTGSEAVAALPTSIRVGAHDIAVVHLSPGSSTEKRCWGEFSSISSEIRMCRDIPTATRAVETFMHEISHAIFWSYGVEDEDKEERIVSAMGAAWAQIYRDNPSLLLWLQDVCNSALTLQRNP